MKKTLIAVLMIMMVVSFTMLTACGMNDDNGSEDVQVKEDGGNQNTESENTEPLEVDVNSAAGGVSVWLDFDPDWQYVSDESELEKLYPGLKDVGLKQMTCYKSPEGGMGTELVIAEVEDSQKVKDAEKILEKRIEEGIKSGIDTANWQNNSKVLNPAGNYVLMLSIPEGEYFPDDSIHYLFTGEFIGDMLEYDPDVEADEEE